MNKIEQELGKLITQSRKDIPVIEDCYSLLVKHCKAFAEFYFINEFNSNKDDCLTTEELFKLYIEQL